VRLEAQHISKSFGPTHALTDVPFTLEPGKVHALVGENGAGKSTLFKICAGVISKDKGDITLDGKPYTPRNMGEAQNRGVALVFQEITINPSLDIAENIFVDRMRQHAGLMGLTSWKTLRKQAQMVLDRIDAGISVNQNLTQLNLGQLKVLEVARAISYDPRVLLLDESTAFLSTREIDTLFGVIATLREQGISIGYISHYLDEVEKIADEITILKDGAWVGRYQRGELTTDEIESQMVGREIGEHMYPEVRTYEPAEAPTLELKNLSIPGHLREVSLSVYRGEVLGLGGLKGAGGEALLSVLTGDMPVQKGSMTLEGRRYKPHSPVDAWQAGIAYVPGERTREGLILNFSVRDNLSMAAIPRRGPFVNAGAEKTMVEELIPRLKIKAESPLVPCTSLSGGNLQKVVLGKCVAAKPTILLLNNPTRGVDVGARMHIYEMIRQLAESGVSVLLLSEDLPELIGNSDRIAILRKGKVNKVFKHTEFPSEEEIITFMI
jgi:ribose transport system ATP-binding protein